MLLTRTTRRSGFGDRFRQACDDSPHCPRFNSGRYSWIVAELKWRFDTTTPTEMIRKYHHGLAQPRQEKAEMLAEILNVDPHWLFAGSDLVGTAREQRAKNALASGVVNVVAGLIQMDGGVVAFPEEGDKKAARARVDLWAVIKGVNHPIHVATGRRDGASAVVSVPLGVEGITLGVIRDGFSFTVVEIGEDMVASAPRRSGLAEVTLTEQQVAEAVVPDFTQRL